MPLGHAKLDLNSWSLNVVTEIESSGGLLLLNWLIEGRQH